MRTKYRILTPAIAILALGSCKPDIETENKTIVDVTPHEILVTELAPLVGKEWRLTDLCGEVMPGDARATLKFMPEDRISGRATVNRYNGPLRLVKDGIEVGPFATTRMAGSPEDMERERAYLAALEAAKSISTIGDDQLVIAVDGKELPLRFELIPQP